jgi:hypothetical protein
MLQSLLYQSTSAAYPTAQPAAIAPNAEVARSTRIEKLEKIIADTVSRVLVSDPLHDGNREIRLEIAREVLPDTSVRLWREAGRLHVEFVSSASVAASALSASLPRLVTAIQQLDARLEAPVVSLRLDADTGQPGDGRSRQRYYQPDENSDLA